MSDPFVSEIRYFAFTYAPANWAFCNGQTVPITQYTALFSLLGITFGGDGRKNFGLPNLQGNVVVGQGQGPGLSSYQMGQTGGATTQTLTLQQMPSHNHTLEGVPPPAGTNSPANATLARTNPGSYQTSDSSLQAMNAAAIQAVGGGGPHNNMMPFVVLNPCIALVGAFPEFN